MGVKIPTIWTPQSSGTVTTVNTGVVRYLQDGVTARVEQDGATQRTLQENVVTLKNQTVWTETP